MNVVLVNESNWTKDDGTVVRVTNVTFDDGKPPVPGYDLPSVPEVGKPLPGGWEIATSKAGKPYIKVPKAGKGGFGGGAPAHRNTKEGQAFEQQQMNRRTALMQAVAWESETAGVVVEIAETFYAWLMQTSPVATARMPVAGDHQSVTPAGAPVADEGESGGSASVDLGEGQTVANPDSLSHIVPDIHEPNMYPIKTGSSIFRCAHPGCPITEKR